MLIDMHMHEATYSPDSFLQLKDMVATARGLGLDGICITDHDSMGLRSEAEAYAQATGFPIFVGIEYYSLEGDIVAFGIEDYPRQRIPAQAFIDLVHAQGGVCFAAHPYRNNNRGLGDNLFKVRGLDGIEAFNASTSFEANVKALDICYRQGIQPIGVSDCHVPEKVGVYATYLPEYVTTMQDFVTAFKRGDCYPVGLMGGQYVDLRQAAAMLRPETAALPKSSIRFETGAAAQELLENVS